MRQLKMIGLALISMFALGAVLSGMASAALPDIHLLSGETVVKGSGTIGKVGGKKSVAFLETEVGSKLEAEELKALLEIKGLTPLGPFDLHFAGVVEPKSGNACETTGDARGVVLVKGEYHIVFINLKPLEAAILVLFEELTIKCLNAEGTKDTIKIKVKPPALASLKASDMVEVTEFGVIAKCAGKGKQELNKYLDNEGKNVEKQLLKADFGLGAENSCEQTEEIKIKAEEKGMVEFLF